MSLHDTPTETIDIDEGVLVLTWKEATRGMAEQQFFDAMIRFGDLAIEHGTTGLLVDVRAFHFRPGPAMGPFRRDEVIPRYNRAGVTRFGFLYPEGQVPAQAMQDGGAGYASDNFDDRAAALAWCAGG